MVRRCGLRSPLVSLQFCLATSILKLELRLAIASRFTTVKLLWHPHPDALRLAIASRFTTVAEQLHAIGAMLRLAIASRFTTVLA